ncbi:MAG: methanogenesis marker 17 protein [Candidatus Verstraetearchaeota archaeon]|nr:methanogenesis marker 17 protein [Candidatus Verstraetearchaeota archaeon]
MKIVVVSSDNTGGEMYRHIVERNVEDLALGNSVTGIAVLIKPEFPLFVMKVKYREREIKNKIGELARIEARSGSVRVILEDEIDLGDALRSLWSTYGRDKVEQSGRTEIVVRGAEPESLKELKIKKERVSVSDKVNELVNRVIPEGFRVRHVIKEGDLLTVMAAEDPIREDWKKMAADLAVDE